MSNGISAVTLLYEGELVLPPDANVSYRLPIVLHYLSDSDLGEVVNFNDPESIILSTTGYLTTHTDRCCYLDRGDPKNHPAVFSSLAPFGLAFLNLVKELEIEQDEKCNSDIEDMMNFLLNSNYSSILNSVNEVLKQMVQTAKKAKMQMQRTIPPANNTTVAPNNAPYTIPPELAELYADYVHFTITGINIPVHFINWITDITNAITKKGGSGKLTRRVIPVPLKERSSEHDLAYQFYFEAIKELRKSSV